MRLPLLVDVEGVVFWEEDSEFALQHVHTRHDTRVAPEPAEGQDFPSRGQDLVPETDEADGAGPDGAGRPHSWSDLPAGFQDLATDRSSRVEKVELSDVEMLPIAGHSQHNQHNQNNHNNHNNHNSQNSQNNHNSHNNHNNHNNHNYQQTQSEEATPRAA